MRLSADIWFCWKDENKKQTKVQRGDDKKVK